jgi:hypothetical protein
MSSNVVKHVRGFCLFLVVALITFQSKLRRQWNEFKTTGSHSIITFGRRQARRNVIVKSTATKTKRLLAIRVSSSSGEVPEESIASIQASIFGYGTNPDNISLSDATVIAQYTAISHGQLQFVPVTKESILDDTAIQTELTIDSGVLDMMINNVTFDGQAITNLTEIILEQTKNQFGSGLLSLLDIADHIIFCLPTGSLFNNDPNWTAYTYLNEPYSYYQLSRCTRLSVVAHEVSDMEYFTLGFIQYNLFTLLSFLLGSQ